MRLLVVIMMLLALYALAMAAVLEFKPPFKTTDVREARKFHRNCNGHVHTEQVGDVFIMECREKK